MILIAIVLTFYPVTLTMAMPHSLAKRVNFRDRMTDHITACPYGIPSINWTTMFLNVVTKMNLLPKNTVLKLYFYNS